MEAQNFDIKNINTEVGKNKFIRKLKKKTKQSVWKSCRNTFTGTSKEIRGYRTKRKKQS